MKKLFIIGLVLLLSFSLFAVTIYEDNFDNNTSKLAGWYRSSSSYVTRYTGSIKLGAGAMRLRKYYKSIVYLNVKPFKNMKLYFKMAAYSLESGEYVRCQYNTGSGWKTAKTLYNGADDKKFRSYSVSIPNCNVLKIKFYIKAGSTYDYAYIDNVKLVGDRK